MFFFSGNICAISALRYFEVVFKTVFTLLLFGGIGLMIATDFFDPLNYTYNENLQTTGVKIYDMQHSRFLGAKHEKVEGDKNLSPVQHRH